MAIEITQDIARKVLTTVDAGLVSGMGSPTPGSMCVEAAVCYALGLPHGDDPQCVAPALRRLKIRLNDSNWSSNTVRARGLRRLAVAQLGSKDNLDEKAFVARLVDYAIRTSVPLALRAAASVQKDSNHKARLLLAANRCEKEGTQKSAQNARTAAAAAAAYAYADAAVRDKALGDYAEAVVQILIDLKVPGCQWLPLTEEIAA